MRAWVRGAVGACLLIPLSFVLARPASAAVRLSVDAGFDGMSIPGTVVPITVEVNSDRLLRGSLVVSSGAGSSARDVEVSPGTVKKYLLFVDTIQGGPDNVVVILQTEGSKAAETRAELQPPGDRELVGLLPGVLGPRGVPGSAPLAVDVGTAKFVRLDGPLLEHAPVGLDSLSTIGAAAGDLARLADVQRRGILAWVADGGRLLVDVEPGRSVQGLPRGWHADAGWDRSAAGLGEVVFTDGAMADGSWDGLIEPTARTGYAGSSSQTFLPQSLAGEAGVRPPPLGPVFGILVAYVLIVGPIAYLVLRGRRREALAWVVIPVLSIVFTGFSLAGAVLSRGGSRVAHGTLLFGTEGGARTTTVAGVVSAGGGTRRIAFPGATHVSGVSDGSFAMVDARRVARDDGVAVPMNPGQFTAAQASRFAPGGEALVVNATSKGTQISGTIRNASSFNVAEAAVVVGDQGTWVGPLDAGDQRKWSIDVAESPNRRSVAMTLWRNRIESADTRVNYGLWQQLGWYGGADVVVPGRAVALGWTDGFDPAVAVDGKRTRPRGTTLVMGMARVDGAGLSRLAVFGEQVRGGPRFIQEPGQSHPNGEGQAGVVRFVLPRDAKGKNLELLTSAGMEGPGQAPGRPTFEVWQQDRWETVDQRPPEGVAGDPAAPDVKPGIVIEAVPVGPPDAEGMQFEGPPLASQSLPPLTGRVIYVRTDQQMTFDGTAAQLWLKEA